MAWNHRDPLEATVTAVSPASESSPPSPSSPRITHIPHDGPRVETGAVQFGDDWPGLFIRGDDAFASALALTIALEHMPPELHATSTLRDLLATIDDNVVHGPLQGALSRRGRGGVGRDG